MVKKALIATALVAFLAPATAMASSTSLNEAVQEFKAAYGHQSMTVIDEAGQGVWFAGLFASDPSAAGPGAASMDFLLKWQSLWGFDPSWHLVVAEVSSISTLTYVRLVQTHEGIPFEGAGAKVTMDGAGRVMQVVVRFDRSQDAAPSSPGLSLEDAGRILAVEFPELVPTGQYRLAYIHDPAGPARLAWVLRSHAIPGPEAPEVYIDAHTGEVLMARDTNIYADGNVYDPNPAVDSTLYRRELLNLTSTTNLDGTYARSFSCTGPSGWDMCPGRVRHAAPDTSGHYLFSPDEPSTTDPFAEVMAYYHMNKINTHMEDSYGHRFTCSGHRWMDASVNMDYENAWFGDQNDDGCADVTIGQGTYDFAYDAAILYHEFGHGINHTYTELRWAFDGLGPDNSPQGIDEAFADYWAATLIGRSSIGEYAAHGSVSELGIRDISIFASCPDNIFGESHYDSPMLSSTLWDIREDLGQEKTDRLSLATLDSLSARPTFDEVGRALLSQAAALQSSGVLTATDVAAVDAAVSAHTLVGCERIVVMEHGDTHNFLAPGGYGDSEVPSGVQFMMYAPPGATRVSAVLTAFTYGTGEYSVYVNRGSPVHFTRSGWSLIIDDYDFRFDGSPDRVSFTEWSDPTVEGDTEYYFTYVHSTDYMLVNVEAIIIATTPPDTATDVIEDPVTDPVEDVPADVPADPEEETAVDASTDVEPPPGTIHEDKGCGCSIVR